VQAEQYDPEPAINAALTALGFKDFRAGYPWQALHYKGGGVWDWDRSDKWYAALPAGMRCLCIISPFGPNPPVGADLALYASFLQQFATRYDVDFEWMNEPDLPQNWEACFPGWNADWDLDQAHAAYAATVQTIVPLIRAANPKAKIISGGTSGVNVDWATWQIAQGWFADGTFDGYGVHPYGQNPSTIAEAYNVLFKMLPTGAMIYTTEWGDADLTQLKAMYAAHQAMGVPYDCWYRLDDNGQQPDDWGIIDQNDQPVQPAYNDALAINAAL
jgi:hypothetical protein